MDIDGPLIAVPVVAPHPVEQLSARQGQAEVGGQVGEQIELPGGQGDHGPGPTHLPAPGIHFDGTEVTTGGAPLAGFTSLRRSMARTRATSSRAENGLVT